jgi:hypothetical protein
MATGETALAMLIAMHRAASQVVVVAFFATQLLLLLWIAGTPIDGALTVRPEY